MRCSAASPACTGAASRTRLGLFHQVSAAAFLCACVLAGVLTSAANVGDWAFVGIETLVAGVGSVVTDRMRLRPVGPFFGVFAFGACAATPLDTTPWVPALVAVLSAACAIAVGFAGWFRVRTWHPGKRRTPAPHLMPTLPEHLATGAMYVVAVGLAGSLATAMGWGHPYWAMASAAIPLSAAGAFRGNGTRIPPRHRDLCRPGGCRPGPRRFHPPCFPGTAGHSAPVPHRAVHHAALRLSLVFFTPLILAMTYLANPGPLRGLVLDRAAETTIGAVIGMLVLFLFMRSRREKAVTAASAA